MKRYELRYSIFIESETNPLKPGQPLFELDGFAGRLVNGMVRAFAKLLPGAMVYNDEQIVEEEIVPQAKEDYCTQNSGDCDSCSLVSYGRDCQNHPVRQLTPEAN